jgi:hypothetical protein
MTLTEFLLARIAEDETVARATLASFDPLDWSGDGWEDAWHMQGPVDGPSGYGSLVVDPQRVLAQCQAIRAAIEAAWGDHLRIEGEWGMCKGQEELEAANDYPDVVAALGSIYAGHPDYDETWRP